MNTMAIGQTLVTDVTCVEQTVVSLTLIKIYGPLYDRKQEYLNLILTLFREHEFPQVDIIQKVRVLIFS